MDDPNQFARFVRLVDEGTNDFVKFHGVSHGDQEWTRNHDEVSTYCFGFRAKEFDASKQTISRDELDYQTMPLFIFSAQGKEIDRSQSEPPVDNPSQGKYYPWDDDIKAAICLLKDGQAVVLAKNSATEGKVVGMCISLFQSIKDPAAKIPIHIPFNLETGPVKGMDGFSHELESTSKGTIINYRQGRESSHWFLTTVSQLVLSGYFELTRPEGNPVDTSSLDSVRDSLAGTYRVGSELQNIFAKTLAQQKPQAQVLIIGAMNL